MRSRWRQLRHNCTTPTPNPSPAGCGLARFRQVQSDQTRQAGFGWGGEHTEFASRAAGFTLLELLIVLTILAVVAVFAVPQLAKPSDRLRLQAAARDLTAALRLTRSSAISRNAEIALVVDVDARAFESPAVPRKSLPSDIDVQLKVAEPERPTRSRGGFRFYADGSSTGGDIVLRLRDNEARICVSWLTGKAEEGKAC